MNELTVPNLTIRFGHSVSLINLFDYHFTSAHTDCMVKLLKNNFFFAFAPKRCAILRKQTQVSNTFFNLFSKDLHLTELCFQPSLKSAVLRVGEAAL
ncbi:hypothetical protein C9I91_17730 [Photobacterium jeanii]|nr:hypothetical protein C9I91_17730 [Photobacterium jeanii]